MFNLDPIEQRMKFSMLLLNLGALYLCIYDRKGHRQVCRQLLFYYEDLKISFESRF